MKYLMAIFSIVLLVGCIPSSDNPLTKPNKNKIDKSIVGTWIMQDKGQVGYLHIGIDRNTKLFKIIMVNIDKKNKLNMQELSGYNSILDNQHYLNIKFGDKSNKKESGYIFIKYTISSNELKIWLINSEAVKKAIISKSLKGTTSKDDWLSTPHITESQHKLQKFIVKNNKLLFNQMYIYTKANNKMK